MGILVLYQRLRREPGAMARNLNEVCTTFGILAHSGHHILLDAVLIFTIQAGGRGLCKPELMHSGLVGAKKHNRQSVPCLLRLTNSMLPAGWICKAKCR